MKLNNIKRISILLSIALMISIILGASFPMLSYAKAESGNIEKVLQQTLEYMMTNKEGFSDAWPIIGVARQGSKDMDKISGSYITNLKKQLHENKGILTTNKYSDYSKVILVLTSLGMDPKNIEGYNLLENLSDMDKLTIQGINGPVWALLAIDSNDYTSPISKETLIDYLLEKEIPGGGWALSTDMPEADVDITAMVLTSLSKYKDRADVKPYIERGLQYLSKAQKPNGGFETLSAFNSESSSQVIIALTSLKIDPLTDSRFIKNGNSVIDNLFDNFYNGKGGFSHLKNSAVNKIATEQAFLALVSYTRLKANKLSLYDMTDMKIIVEDGSEQETEETKNPFIDIGNDIEKVAIIELNKKGIIEGITQIEFQPNKSISRAEFATLLSRALGKEETHKHGFIDVKQTDWFSGHVGAAKTSALINGYPDNTFKPLANITRQEAAMIIYNTAKMKGIDVSIGDTELRNYLSQFPDYIQIADWSRVAMGFAVKKGYMPDEILNIEPKRDATRSEDRKSVV